MGATRGPASGAGRFESWRAGWRVALRMARRDVRRHRGRSLLIVAMIGLPVLLISAGATFVFSSSLDQSEQVPYLFGTGQAIVVGPVVDRQISQEPLGHGYGHSDESPPAEPIPGLEADPTAAIARLTGGTATRLLEGTVRVEVAGKTTPVQALGVALPPQADLGQRARLVSGRWPANSGEVVVTTWGVTKGLPASGVLAIDAARNSEAAKRPHTVVGIAEAVTGSFGEITPASVVLMPWDESGAGTALTGLSRSGEENTLWLISDRGPVSWAEVKRLNDHGLLTQSHALWSLAPSDRPIDSEHGYDDTTAANTALMMAAAAAGLLFTTALLAGPAFAVSAIRQRRTLALSAANGASPTQLRRIMLAQAVVLGGLSTAIGIVLGVAIVAAARPALAPRVDDQLAFGLDVGWGFLATVAGSAVLSAVVAALLPARTLGRLDIVRAMRGQEVARPVRHRFTLVGVVLLTVGVILTLTQVEVSDGAQQAGAGLIGGSAALTLGALCVVPSLLTLAGRLSRHLPVSLRMAARDSARQRARTGPTVAAVMASAALLSASVIAVASDTAEQAHTYMPTVAAGTATAYDSTLDPSRVAELVASVDPTIITFPSGTLASAAGQGDMPWGTGPGRLVQAQRRDCTFEESRPNQTSYPEQRCWSVGTDGTGGVIRTAPTAGLASLLALDAEQRRSLADGAVVLPDPSTIPQPARPGTFDAMRPAPVDVQGGAVRFWVVDGETDDNGTFWPSSGPATVALPALVLPWDQFALGQTMQMGGYSAYLAAETAERLGWASQPAVPQLVDPTGPISRTTEARLTAALGAASENAQVQVERGFQRPDAAPVLILMTIIGLLILVATLVSTALSMAEQQPLMGTLAAVGATRLTRRKLAAAQAFLLAGLGAAVGATIGIFPGIAAATTVTTSGGYYPWSAPLSDGTVPEALGPFVVIPWLQVTGPVLVVPFVAAAFAFISIRRAPAVTRRAT